MDGGDPNLINNNNNTLKGDTCKKLYDTIFYFKNIKTDNKRRCHHHRVIPSHHCDDDKLFKLNLTDFFLTQLN